MIFRTENFPKQTRASIKGTCSWIIIRKHVFVFFVTVARQNRDVWTSGKKKEIVEKEKEGGREANKIMPGGSGWRRH